MRPVFEGFSVFPPAPPITPAPYLYAIDNELHPKSVQVLQVADSALWKDKVVRKRFKIFFPVKLSSF